MGTTLFFFSKTLGAGFRIGWVYAGKFSEHIQHTQLMSTLSVNSFIQNALVEYLSHRHYEKHLKTLRSTLQRYKKQYFNYLKPIYLSNVMLIIILQGTFYGLNYLNKSIVMRSISTC